jgi:hypothetical protein
VRLVDDDVDGLVEALQGSLKHQIMEILRVETTEITYDEVATVGRDNRHGVCCGVKDFQQNAFQDFK